MKKSFGYFTLLMLVFILIFAGCKKYNEGPSFSLRTKKARITNDWKVYKVNYDDKENTNDFFNIYNYCYFTIKSDLSMIKETSTNQTKTTTTGTWKFIDIHSVLEFDEKQITQNDSIFTAKTQHEFIILKLTHKEIALKEKIAGHSITYYCNKK
jgi:hypothetical protein